MKQQGDRHGELLLLRVEELPGGLVKSKSKVIAAGSHGNNHTFDNGVLFEGVEDKTILYLKAEGTSLLHPEHSPNVGTALIPDGFYKVIKQTEHTPAGLIPVVD